MIQPIFTMKERTGKQLETISQLLCELSSRTTEIDAVTQQEGGTGEKAA